MTERTRLVCGNLRYRRYAYLKKDDYSIFGLLEAVNYKDAKKHLGSHFFIRKTWLNQNEENAARSMDKSKMWPIVQSIFLFQMSAGYVGD